MPVMSQLRSKGCNARFRILFRCRKVRGLAMLGALHAIIEEFAAEGFTHAVQSGKSYQIPMVRPQSFSASMMLMTGAIGLPSGAI